jgi:Ca2+-binding RTX toxin-like protein
MAKHQNSGNGVGEPVLGDTDGNDFIAGEGDDRSILMDFKGQDGIYGGAGADTMTGGQGNDRLAGDTGEDALRGGADDDFLAGQQGDDRLEGGDGDDELYGDDGSDIPNGGRGVDMFTIWAAEEQAGDGDVIDDIEVGIDWLVIYGADQFIFAEETETGIALEFETGGSLFLAGISAAELDAVLSGTGFDYTLLV